jgi:hypothetical protein
VKQSKNLMKIIYFGLSVVFLSVLTLHENTWTPLHMAKCHFLFALRINLSIEEAKEVVKKVI